MITKSIGKNTLGGGNKMEVRLKNYERSTHDLSHAWRSTAAAGVLIPCYKEIGLPGDVFDINIAASVLTHPTVGPLFGSFKLQIDFFECPIRLYQKVLHNNALNIGLDMSKVKLPKIRTALYTKLAHTDENEFNQIHPSSLMAYLGRRGWGESDGTLITASDTQCIPVLAYWDIFKNYYANKQEENAYYIGASGYIARVSNMRGNITYPNIANNKEGAKENLLTIFGGTNEQLSQFIINTGGAYTDISDIMVVKLVNDHYEKQELLNAFTLVSRTGSQYIFKSNKTNTSEYDIIAGIYFDIATTINSFKLENIDEMREKILSAPSTSPFFINTSGIEPYNQYGSLNEEEDAYLDSSPMFGLALKTYQSDKFNNWINTEWLDGEGGINEITAISTADGSFTIDTLNLSKKVYDMLNRIAISGGTYDDWIETVYTNEYINRSESPIYMGGMSQEVEFQEVISNSASGDEPLGTLAGRGVTSNSKKGGYVKIKCTEPCYIIGIMSLTPRVDYCQGNEWDTYLESMDDLHKPALDGIGFQDLLLRNFAWWADIYNGLNTGTKKAIGKQPAWIDYMTSYNKTYGNFALKDNEAFMCLNRFFEKDATSGEIDASTYIHPDKYNDIFAETSLTAQNFWVQIAYGVKARRKMSAKIIPNL